MLFSRSFYELNKDAIENTAEKLKKLFRDMIAEKFTLLNKLQGKELEEYSETIALNDTLNFFEQRIIYTTYEKGYASSTGYVFAVYITYDINDKEKLINLVEKYFGKFKLRDKKGCKVSNYKVYNEKTLDFVFENETIYPNGYKLSLNLIFNGDIFKDKKKFFKWADKATKDLAY